MEDGARRPPSYLKIAFLLAGGRGTEATVLLWFPYSNNEAKNNEAGYLKSRTVASVPRPPIPKLCSHREDGARRPPSYLKIPFLVAGGRGTETTVLLFRYSFWLLLFGGKYTKAAEDVCPRPLYWFSVCCFSLLFPVCFLHFLFYCSVQWITPIRR